MASIFWGFYESAERRLLMKYYDGSQDVVELGASIGIISSHIAGKLKPNRKLICVEANSNLLPTLRNNIQKRISSNSFFYLEHKAVNVKLEEVDFFIASDTTASSIAAEQSDETTVIKTTTLSSLVSQYNLSSYFLVCDIEGAEAELLWHDVRAFDNCIGMIIELHHTHTDGTEKSIDDMVQRCISYFGFHLKEQDGNVFCFMKY
ncbi:MAG: FkbM family methyltransferase [Bacteroidota bacterium]|nr:FkbM family methyltransferase [Bacteroidota bacterium]